MTQTTDIKATPDLRFPKFMDGWKEHPLVEICDFSTGKNIKQNEASPEFQTPCVRYGELYHMYSEVIHEVVNRTNLEKSDLVFSLGNEILLPSAGEDPLDIGSASALTLKNVAIGRTINILRPKKADIYSQIYLSYYINQHLRIPIARIAKGVSISNVYNSDLKKLSAFLPSLPEQEKIAAFLTAVDDRLQALQKKKSLLEQYKKGIMQRVFNYEEGNDELRIRFKDEDGQDFPDWEVKKLGEIAEFHRGSPFSKKDIDEKGENYCIHYGELFTKYNEVIQTVISRTKAKGKLSKVGDVLMPSSDVTPEGLATASCILKENVLLGGDINIIRPIIDIDSVYLSYKINHIKSRILKIVSGTTVKHIYNKDLKKLVLALPSLPEQKRIADFLTAIDHKIELVEEQIAQTDRYKQGLLQKMFV